MHDFQLSQGYGATTRRQFAFLPFRCQIFMSSWCSIDRCRKDERLQWPWSQQVVSVLWPLDSESSSLSTTLLYVSIRNLEI